MGIGIIAHTDSYDELAGRYRGLHCGQMVHISDSNMSGLLVKPDVSLKQQEAEVPQPTVVRPPVTGGTGTDKTTETKDVGLGGETVIEPEPKVQPPKRFHGSVNLNPLRISLEAGRINEEVIAHQAGLVGSNVTVTLEIEVEVSSGVPENVVRTVTENSRTLKFKSQGFERE